MLANGIGPGDEVITTPFTFIATINAILFAGAKPVFVDVDEETFNLDVSQVESKISPRTKAIMPVHLYGYVCNMDGLMAISEKHGLKIIEDACQSVLATFQGKFAGSFGTGAFSFYATKNLMTGEGGMITTNDEAVAKKCRLIRNHGMQRRYYHDMLGFNYRITDLQSAIGLVQLERLPKLTNRRRANATYFNENINSVITPKVKPGYEHVWHQYTIRIQGGGRDAAVKCLNDAGIGTGIYYPVPAHKQGYVEELLGIQTLPVAERLSNEVISLPVHPQLSQEEIDHIAREVNRL
jgi:dTDP-4-amino-4,6-dideoxygalactose transaminase